MFYKNDESLEDEILKIVHPTLYEKMYALLERGLHYTEEITMNFTEVEKAIDNIDIYNLYRMLLLVEEIMHEIKFPVDLEKNKYPWVQIMPIYWEYYPKGEALFEKMKKIRSKILHRKELMRGKKDTFYKDEEKIKMLDNSLTKILQVFHSLEHDDTTFYEKLYDKLTSLRPYDIVRELDKYDFNYIDEDKQSYYLFEILIISVFKMRLQKTNAKEREKMLLASKKNIESIRLNDILRSNQKILDLIDLSIVETEELNKVAKNQINAYVAKVFQNFYNFTEENIKGVMRFMLTDTRDNTSFLKQLYQDITIHKKIVNGIEVSNLYEKKTDILYPHILLNLDEF